MEMLKPIRTGTVVLGMGLAWCCGCCILATPDSFAQEPSKAGKCYVLSIQGMTCEDCAKHVQKALEKVDGIAEAKVNFTKGPPLLIVTDFEIEKK